MKKVNKILMATVAILLSLVLLSTSILSGVFARFAVTRGMDATMSFKKLGVLVEMSVPQKATLEAAPYNATVSAEVKDGYSGVITISNLKMAPGMDFTNAVRFQFSNAPEVPVQIKITPTVTYNTDASGNAVIHTSRTISGITYYNYYVPASTIKNGNSYMSATYYMPIGFTFSANGTTATGNYVLDPWKSGAKNAVEAADIHNAIATGIQRKITNSTYSNNVVTTARMTDAVSFTIGGVAVTGFNMGFAYPLDWPSATDANKEKFDKIATYIAEHTEDSATITVSYKVEIIQVP